MHKRKSVFTKVLAFYFALITLFLMLSPVFAAAGLSADMVYVVIDYNGGVDKNGLAGYSTSLPRGYTITIPSFTGMSISKPGYIISGFYNENNKKTYQPGDKVTVNNDTTFQLRWAANEYSVKFDNNGGSNGPGTATKMYDKDLVLSSKKPTKMGYSFTGWKCSADSKIYQPGDFYKLNKACTMTARWQANVYAVKFDCNGGENGPDTATKTHDKTLILSGKVPTKEDYTFTGWKCSADGVIYQPGDSYRLNKECTMVAQWGVTKPDKPTGFITLPALIAYFLTLLAYLINII